MHLTFQPLLGTDEVSGDVMIGSQIPWWRSLNMHMIVGGPQSVLWFLFPLGQCFLLFVLTDWLLLCCQIWNIHNLIIWSCLNSFQVDFNHKCWQYWEFLSTNEDISHLECDIRSRALRILKEAEVILAEDTRHSAKLLRYYNIDTPMVSMNFNHWNAFTVIQLRQYVFCE